MKSSRTRPAETPSSAHDPLSHPVAAPLHPAETEALTWPRWPEAYRPDYGRSLTGIMPTLYRLLGQEAPGHADLRPYLPAGSPRSARRGFLLCLDGFGFKELAQSERFRQLYPHCGTWITSVFPSITSCALSSIYQALPPARHGVLGHHVWKDFPGGVVDMLKMQAQGAQVPLAAAGFDVHAWKREPGFLETPVGMSLPAYHLMHYSIVNSGLSTYSYGKATLVGFAETLEGFTKGAKILSDLERGWVGLYLATVDTLTHALGGDSPQIGLAVRQIEQALAWMASTLKPEVAAETLFMVIADHGQSMIRHTIKLEREQRDWLQLHTRGIGFSGRVMHVYLAGERQQQQEVAAWLQDLTGDAGRVFAFEEVADIIGQEGAGGDPWARRTLGDLVVILREGHNWDKYGLMEIKKVYPTLLVSQHGGLSWNEMFVPMLCAPLTAMLE